MAFRWTALSSLSIRSSCLLLASMFIAGIIFWGGFNWSMELTNTEAFCISCHEMNDNVYQEYRHTIHYSNRTGVRATCPDCHVPKEWIHKVKRKIAATNELLHKVMGTIDTVEKFRNRRSKLANHVWQSMQATNSRECRNCHDIKVMNLASQSSKARTIHELSIKWNKTCIDCHKGIAHTLPPDFSMEAELDAQHEKIEAAKIACYLCHEDMAKPPADEEW